MNEVTEAQTQQQRRIIQIFKSPNCQSIPTKEKPLSDEKKESHYNSAQHSAAMPKLEGIHLELHKSENAKNSQESKGKQFHLVATDEEGANTLMMGHYGSIYLGKDLLNLIESSNSN